MTIKADHGKGTAGRIKSKIGSVEEKPALTPISYMHEIPVQSIVII